jgi:hypothetical protein
MLLMWIVRKQNITFFFTLAISKFLPKILLEFIYTFSLLEKHVIFIQKFCEKNVGIYTFSMLKKTCFKVHLYAQKNVL